jgi:hypothetical protein
MGFPGDSVDIALGAVDEPYYDESTKESLGQKLGSTTWYSFRTADCGASVATMKRHGVAITRAVDTTGLVAGEYAILERHLDSVVVAYSSLLLQK